ncbi:MAG: 30S ribosome-binding factor RbfA [Chloroflexota bacterium]
MTQRTDRVDELIRQEIGEILARDVSDPRIGFATITRVETAQDLGHAKVWVSIIGQPEERDATLRALGRAMPFVRHQLGSRIRLRRIPELHLRLDETADRGTRILQLLSELDEGRVPEADRPISETLPTPVRRLPADGDAPDEPGRVPGPPMPPAPNAENRRPRRPSGAGRPPGRGRPPGAGRPPGRSGPRKPGRTR